MQMNVPHSGPERFVTLRQASNALGVPYFKIRRFVNAGSIPIYHIGNRRKLVRLSELLAAVENDRVLKLTGAKQ